MEQEASLKWRLGPAIVGLGLVRIIDSQFHMSPTSVANALALLSVVVPATHAQLGKPRTQGWGRRRSLLRDSEGRLTSMSMDFDAKEEVPSIVFPMRTSEAAGQSSDCKDLKKKRKCRKKNDCKWRDGECRLVASSGSITLATSTPSVSPTNIRNDDLVAFTL